MGSAGSKMRSGMEVGVREVVESSPESNSCHRFGVVFGVLWAEDQIMI